MQLVLTPDLILQAYSLGLFPMAYSADSPYVQWVCPEERGQLSITEMHIPRSLRKLARKMPYRVSVNKAFAPVMHACQEYTDTRPETWINRDIIKNYCDLHEMGFAHSIECWEGDTLVGGLYGLQIGGLFCGESMFSRRDNASKIALVHLVARLWAGGFAVLDTQFVNDHLTQFGVYEVTHADYVAQLQGALDITANFEQHGRDEAILLKEYLDFRALRQG